MTVIWRPEPYTARLIAAARPAAQELGRLAQLRAPSRRIAVRVIGTATNFTVATDGLGTLFEKGVKPHEIVPKGKVLKMADGRFVTGPVRHPGMRSKPFLRPTLPLWPTLYRRHAASAARGGIGAIF